MFFAVWTDKRRFAKPKEFVVKPTKAVAKLMLVERAPKLGERVAGIAKRLRNIVNAFWISPFGAKSFDSV